MEQKPVRGHEALAPPSADIARQYLDEADAVVTRLESSIDRRALGRLQMVNAVAIAAYLVAMAAAIRSDGGGTYQAILFSFLIWGQLASGMAQRSGMQWRMTRSRWPVLLAGGAVLVAALVVFGFVAFDPSFPVAGMLIPAALVLIGFGGYGAVQLARASGEVPAPRTPHAALSRGSRWGTVLVGVTVGLLTMLGSAPEGAVRSALLLLVVLMILAWGAAARSELGLPAVGASWRWPHLVAFAASACAQSLLVLLDGVPTVVGVLSGAGVVLLFIAVSFVPGRDLRD